MRAIYESEIDKQLIIFLYTNKGEYWFRDKQDAKMRFALTEEQIGEGAKFLKPNTIVDAVVFDNTIISLRMPIKVELLVKEAPPALRGNTAQGGTKQITLETGAVINAPLFVNEGDLIRVNTELGSYVERVDKK